MPKVTRRVLLVIGIVAVGIGALALMAPGDLAEAQRARDFAEFDIPKVRDAAWWDFLFMAAYTALFLVLFSFVKREGEKRVHPAAAAGMLLALAGVAADVVENVFVLLAFNGDGEVDWLNEMRAAGLFKYGFLATAALTLVTLGLLRSWRPRLVPGLPSRVPEGKAADWKPSAKKPGSEEPIERRIGICLSGGGIRSAAFSLGALQTLRKAGTVDKADYLAAVSGGGYLAAGWALSQAETPAEADPPPWDPGSPEERWFRDHSSYLIPDAKGGLAGIFRLLAGLAVNVVLVILLLSAVSRPVGWAMHAAFPDFRGHEDEVLVPRDDASADVKVAKVTLLEDVEKGTDEGLVTRYSVELADDTADNGACFLDPTSTDKGDKGADRCYSVKDKEARRALVEVQHGRIEIVRQPEVDVIQPSPTGPQGEVKSQPKLKLAHGPIVADRSGVAFDESRLEVDKQPLVKVTTGIAALKYPDRGRWMWEITGGLAGGALLAALGVTVFRPRGYRGEVWRALARAGGGAALGAALLFVVLPWLVIWLPRTLADAVGATGSSLSGSSVADYAVPGGGLLALVVTAARQYITAGAGPKDKQKTGPFQWIKDRMSKQSKELKWYELSPFKVLAAIASLAALIVVFVNSLQFATVNGPKGKVMGFVDLARDVPSWLFVWDLAEFAVIVVALAVFALAADAHSWSLFPFYKERLSSAYLLQRDGDVAGQRDYDVLTYFKNLKNKPGPQLVACCAVNLSDYGVVPPGRRAASFTFSSTEIGGPVVGYTTPEAFDDLPEARQRDVTVASAMAISGAAFSPAMGKTNLGPIGPLLALANLRLGVWLPHPDRVGTRAAKEWDWRRLRRPHWVWFLRELTNKYKFNRRYLYVSDGGHWDNLGLVELLRRGCNEIYCISGAGDRAESFGTIGEAIALAREELGVEIDLDPSPLRAKTTAAEPLPPRELRRAGAKEKAAVYAAAGAVHGTFTWRDAGAAPGHIYYVEADLTAAIPFDVHTFAEAEIDFPDDSTGDQVFNHRQFESYRALGAYQAGEAVNLAAEQ